MFANVGWGEMLVLVIAGLVILGPERLPGSGPRSWARWWPVWPLTFLMH